MGRIVSATPQPFYPRETDPIPIVQEAGWVPGPVGTGAEYRDSIPGTSNPYTVAMPTELPRPTMEWVNE
jgi:hypothetical protein